MSKEIKTWLDTSLVTMQNNLEELANTIKTIEAPSYDDREIKQNINKLLTFMNKIVKWIKVTVIYDTNRNLATFPFDDENSSIFLTNDELNWIKRTSSIIEINSNYIKLDEIFVPTNEIKELLGAITIWSSGPRPRTYIDIVNAIIKLSPSNLTNLFTILSSDEKISKLNELLK